MLHPPIKNHRVCYVLALIGFVLQIAGCGSNGPEVYPVRGKVVYQDGTPMSEGMVEFEALEGEFSGRNARGLIQDDGTFVLTTQKPGDGAVAGQHRAIIREPIRIVGFGEQGRPPIIDPVFAQYATSGLKFTVKEQENQIEIEVHKPGDRKTARPR
jgi:hypothetical protein